MQPWRDMASAAVVYPSGDTRAHLRRLSVALLPASWIYAVASAGVRRVQLLGAQEPEGSPFVISVGNLEVGGSGKTPFAMHLLGHIRERGERAVYISRGYRSRAERLDAVTVVPPAGVTVSPLPGARVVRRDDPGLAVEVGDEAVLVASRLPEVALLLGRRKADAVSFAARMFAPRYAVLDDAFQSWSVHRHVDVVLLGPDLDRRRLRLLPAGPLREDLDALGRADVVLLAGVDSPRALERAASALRRRVDTGASFAGLTRRLRFLAPSRPEGPVAALSAIGNPEGFERALAREGCDVRVCIRYPDHHRYVESDLAAIERIAEGNGAATVVTTEKDAVKLGALPSPAAPLAVARLELELSDPSLLDKMLKPRREAAASA